MKIGLHLAPRWSTASFGGTVDTSPMELSDLGDHLSLCRAGSGRWFVVRSVAEDVQAFLAARVVTTVMVAGLIAAFSSRLV